MRRALALLGAMALATQLSACQGYLFRQSDRLTITSPANHATVHEPLTITWQAHEFSAPQDGRFAVFVDRDGIYVLDTTSLHIDVLSPLSGVDPAEQNHHDVTVVLLDTQGNRMGEYAGFAEFNVEQST